MINIPNILKWIQYNIKLFFKEHDEIGCGILETGLYVHTSIDLPLLWDFFTTQCKTDNIVENFGEG